MRDPRGTVILCDQLYPPIGGKWVIAGTYTHWTVAPGAHQIDLPPLNVYIRFQVERAGEYDCELLLIHRDLPSNAPAILRQQVRIKVGDPLAPCEMGCILPPFRVRFPTDPPHVPEGTAIGVPFLLWLKVAGEDLASCPLNIIFPPAQGHNHARDANDPAPEHEPGHGP